MKIIHISDTHGHHERLTIPDCDADVLIHSGDIGPRTNQGDLIKFLVWFEKQPAKKKIFIAGNHDICLDKKRIATEKAKGSVEGLLATQYYYDAIKLIEGYNIKYLMNTEYVYNGVKFYGSPYSPSFNRSHWVFNADRGAEITNIWGRIPSDTNVLITHTPPYGVLDTIDERYLKNEDEDPHRGCEDLMYVIHKRLFNLKLHCFGHIHDRYGVLIKHVSNTKHLMFSNAAVLTNQHKQIIKEPIIINI